LWPINETGVGTPLILRHQFKDLENHKNAPKDVTSLEWNVSNSCMCMLEKYLLLINQELSLYRKISKQYFDVLTMQ